MSNKFTYEGYTITVTFKDDFNLSMTASLVMTGEHFMNEAIELGKIKKDTVLATLSRKSEKNLRCEFNMVDSEPRKLVLSFIVNFDYLPEFKEDIVLEQIQAKDEIFNKVSSAQIRSDVLAIEKILDTIHDKGTIMLRQKSVSLINKTEIERFTVPAGQHLLQVTGILTCPSGNQEIFDLILEYGTEKPVVLQMKSNCMSSYGYPYCFSHLIDINEDRQLVIYGQMKNVAVTTTLANHMTTLMPIVKLN